MSLLKKRLTYLFSTLTLICTTSTVFAADITVSAASSLTNAFNDMAKAYQQHYPQDRVHLNFGASGTLLQQIQQGAPIDVFASADQQTMNQAQDKHLINPKERYDFVQNSLVLIVPANNPASIKQTKNLTQPAVKRIAIGNPASVPAGRYTKKALEQAQLWTTLTPKFVYATNVRQALDYVATESTEAGFVFGTDAAIMNNKVRIIATIPTEPIRYPIALTSDSKQPASARRFIQFVRSAAGQNILSKYGFETIQ